MKAWMVTILLFLVATPGLISLLLLAWYVNHHDTLLATQSDIQAMAKCLDQPHPQQRLCAKQFQLDNR